MKDSPSSPQSQSGGKELPVGTRIEEFVIEKVLGSGGFGITYLVRDTSLNRQVVIKENLPSQFAHRDTTSLTVRAGAGREDQDNFRWSLENFTREAETLASLHHPGIVPVLRRFEALGTAYFVMPFIEGSTLDILLQERETKEKPFSEAELQGLLERVLDALAHLHERGIYHRDIKPGNILITDAGMPVLIDFGSARQRLGERSMTVVESAGYTPFEQLQSRGNVGPWSDLYALGGTLCKIITGDTPPKANDRVFDDPWQPLASREDLLTHYSAELLSQIDRALAVRPPDRWQDAREWMAALQWGTTGTSQTQPAIEQTEIVGTEDGPASTKNNSWGWIAVACLAIVACIWFTVRSVNAPASIAKSEVSVLPGSLVITSEPSGATLNDANGQRVGETPTEVKGLKAGEVWNGSLELFGYDVAPVESDVVAGETKLVPSIVLKPTAQKVVITSDPSGADVMLNGEVVGKTPLEIANMPPKSEVAYTLCLDGYDDTQVRRRRTGKTLELKTSLKPKPIVEVAPPSQSSEGNRAGGERDFEIAPGVNITMCWIPAGEFMMGSPAGESGRSEDETQHRVKISKGFWLAKTETTQAQWQAVMGSNPSNFKGADLPVESVSWDDIAGMGGFLARINDSAVDGWHFHLPSEAQWEYACRAGSTRNGDSELGAKAWYAENSGEKTHSVGQKQSNAWGLYDMLGNVCEWCDDWYGACPVSTTTDPSGPTSGSHKVLRGGCWRSDARKCRARHSSLPSSAIIIFGFRVARSSIINEADKGAGASANQIEPAQGPAVEAAASWKTYTNQRFGFRFDYPEVLRSKSNPTNGAGLCFTDGNLTVTAEGHFLTDSFDAWWNSMLKDLGDKVTYKVKKSTWAVISGVGEDGVEFYIKRCVLGGNWAGFSASYPHSMNRKYDPVITQMSEKFVPFLPGDYDRAPYPTIR